MRKTRKIFIIVFLLCIFIYCCKIESIPKSVILYKGETVGIENFFGLSLSIGDEECNTMLTSSNIENKEKNITTTAYVKLFDTFTVKEVSISAIDETTVIPVGQISGLKLYTNGVLVVGMSEIKGMDNQKYKPYENSNMQEGDRIIKINNQEITDTNDLIEKVNKSNGETLEIEYVRNNETNTSKITPIKYVDGTYKIGLWVRDSAAGIGTLTYYEPSTGKFAALGHGISDCDTGDMIEISNGEFLTAKVISIIKGLKRKSTEKFKEHLKKIKL